MQPCHIFIIMTKTSTSKPKASGNTIKNSSSVKAKIPAITPISMVDRLGSKDETDSISKRTKTIRQIEDRLVKNENTLILSLPWIQTNIRNIMKIIAKYDRKSEQYLNSQFEKFEMYSKSIELDIESKIDENTNILENTLDHINEFIAEQEKFKRLEIEGNINDHKQINADIKVIKEETELLINQYKLVEKDIMDIKKVTESEFKDEKTQILTFVKELKTDIKKIDEVFISEKQKTEKAIFGVMDLQKKELNEKIENNLNISKAHQDNSVRSLLAQISTLSTKNNQLVNLITENRKELDSEIKDSITSSKESQDNTIRPLLKQIDLLSAKNNQLVNLITENKDRYNHMLEANIKSSEEHQNNIIKPLLEQMDGLSIKNHQLVKLIDENKDGLSKNKLESVKPILADIKEQLDTLKDTQKSNDYKVMDYVKLIESVQKSETKGSDDLIERLNAIDAILKSKTEQMDKLSTKNNHLVKLIDENRDELSKNKLESVKPILADIKEQLDTLKDTQKSNDSRTIEYMNTLESTQASKADDTELLGRINILEDSQRSNVGLIKEAVNDIKEASKIDSKSREGELVSLLEDYKKRDTERERRMTNMLQCIEQAVENINQKTTTSDANEKSVNDELDGMISELKRIQQESN